MPPIHQSPRPSTTCCSYTGDYGDHQQTCNAAEQLQGLWQVPSELSATSKCNACNAPLHGCLSPAGNHSSCHKPRPSLCALAVWRLTELGGPYQMDPGFKYGAWQPATSRLWGAGACHGRRPCILFKHHSLSSAAPAPSAPFLCAVGMTQAANASAYEILKANFLAAYNGNRAPMPVYVHSFFLRAGDNQQDVERFLGGCWRCMCFDAGRLPAGKRCTEQGGQQACIVATPPVHLCKVNALLCPRSTWAFFRAPPSADFALSQPNTYAVTMRQLLAYLASPVPAEELTPEALGCGRPGGAGPDRPA